MEIHDMEGNKITTLNPGKSKGINTVEWNYNMRTPKIAKGKTLSFGGFTSPTVPAGKYKVVINCLLYTSPSPRDATLSRMPSSA